MKDIDFDELDRAVSSVLEPAADDTTPAVAVTKPTQPAAEPDKTEATPVVASSSAAEATPPAPVEPETPVAASAAKTPLAFKRRGQFMDVVHPSSDMTGKSEAGTSAPVRKVTLQPLSTSVEPESTPEAVTPTEENEPVTDQTADPLSVVVSAESQPSAEAVEATPVDQVMPDPLDVMQAQEATKEAAAAETSTVEDTLEAVPEASEPVPTEEESAPSTPFLADTKVDKRPLDAFSPEETETPAEPTPVDPVVTSEPLPPELQADVVAVEANPSDHVADVADNEAAETDKKDESESGFNTSIPQQYSSTDTKSEDDHSIFDTSEYHQPLAPPKAKKGGMPGWLVALLVMILLAGLSVAGGYYWFYYGL